jgi:SAM-dependent methyltransferase
VHDVTEWFEQWFGEEYLRLYPHRDDRDAGEAVALIDRVIPLAGLRVLDLACGPGRHAAQLAARGARTVGLDLSLPLLSRARARTKDAVALVRADMRRLPFRPGTFDVVVNLFTSFGYFADDRQNAAVLEAAAVLLKSGALFVLDYFNAAAVRDALVTTEERMIGSERVVIRRRLSSDRRMVVKEMRLGDDGRSFVERVRLFTTEDLVHMIEAAGLVVRHQFGDYRGGPAGPGAARVILIGVRP